MEQGGELGEIEFYFHTKCINENYRGMFLLKYLKGRETRTKEFRPTGGFHWSYAFPERSARRLKVKRIL